MPNSTEARLIFRFPPNPGPPGRRVPGGSRPDRCIEEGTTLLALMPQTSYGLTLSDRPFWYFYMPRFQADGLQFQIFDNQTSKQHRQSYQTPNIEGIFEVQAPFDVEPNRSYTWSFSIICDQNNRSKDIVLTGILERQHKPILMAQLSYASKNERISLLSEAGIWHDTLRELAIRRIQSPNDVLLQEYWSELIDSEELAFSTLPSVPIQRLKETFIFPLTPVDTVDALP